MNYLIPEFTGLGDMIQKTPMIRMISELDQDARIYLIGDNRWGGLDVVKNSSFIENACNVVNLLNMELPEKYTNTDISVLYEKISRAQKKILLDWLVSTKWDVFFDSHQSDVPPEFRKLIDQSATGKVCRHLDIQDCIKQREPSLFKQKKTAASIVSVPILKGRHDIDANYDLLEYCLGYPFDRSYDTWTSLGKNQQILKNWDLKKGEYVCLQPGAANGAPTPKTWHPENFVDLCTTITQDRRKKVILVGDSGDLEHIISKRDWPIDVLNMAGKTSIEELGSLIRNAACVVAHDSGIMHLANAMDVPLVALYGPTDYTSTKPLGKKSVTVYSKTLAFAIMYKTNLSEKKLAEEYPDNSAMAGINVDEVMLAVSRLLSDYEFDA